MRPGALPGPSPRQKPPDPPPGVTEPTGRKPTPVPHVFPDLIRTVAAFVVVLGVLVFFHELGHSLAARWRGVYVERFSVGFGRSIASWYDRHGTQWRISWLPLGG